MIKVKCPYSCNKKSFLERSEKSPFFLKRNNCGEINLDVYHTHYCQVQAQLKFCHAKYEDFVVWREGELFVQQIYPDEPFISIILEKCKLFIRTGILPELAGKWYSKEPISTSNTSECGDTTQTELWCYCRKAEEGKMIGCDNSKCPIEWFHLSCLHITGLPGKWYCLECKRKILKNH